jgi:hypothetical protein
VLRAHGLINHTLIRAPRFVGRAQTGTLLSSRILRGNWGDLAAHRLRSAPIAMKRTMTETRLRRAFVDVIAGVLATTAFGCGGGSGSLPSSSSSSTSSSSSSSSGSTSGGTGDWQSACASNQSILKGLRASPALDGIISRQEAAFPLLASPGGSGDPSGGVQNPDSPDDQWKATDGETNGTLCAGASDKAACLDKVKGFRVLPPTRDACQTEFAGSPHQGVGCATNYFLYTRGDEIGVARSDGEKRALMASFDTIEEALWAASRIASRSCGTNGDLPESQFRNTADGGWDLKLYDEENCGKETFAVTVHVSANGDATEVSREALNKKPSCAVAGRRPDGLSPEALCASRLSRLDALRLDALRLDDDAAAIDGGVLGAHFAEMATLEAASVIAFRRLYRDLARHGAPTDLLERARKAARDEIRHARATGKLAEKFGVAAPRMPKIEREDLGRSLMTIAKENAREGCVRETYGAMVAHLQVVRAGDADVRDVMAAIADEETEHAALSWDIAEWIESQLDGEQRKELAGERRRAFDQLKTDLALEDLRAGDDAVALAGHPTSVEALSMLDALAPTLRLVSSAAEGGVA